ncbi:ABC transporter ATP-binding protein [Oceanobacter mangrovi]|uniref:ABC transporter ATP-binding protein n=1 Tax=Oceanobacter mangrovi TaxID=2862510 RepID=UPI001C8E7161|nr:ATP-binding cassette domain-containing protein [Oceanobacter mangrovi]
MTHIRLDNIGCRILAGLSLHVDSGQAVAILGPSGSGKSTLLKVIAGLLPASGKLYFDHQDISKQSPHQRGLAYLSQDLHLFPHLSVKRNLWLALLFGCPKGINKRERIRQALIQARAEHLAERWPTQLSGGERQRVALARCLARQPGLMLLDEPFSSLDPANKQALWQELDQLRRQLGMTLILVTHDPLEAQALADRVYNMAGGQLLSHDDPAVPAD